MSEAIWANGTVEFNRAEIICAADDQLVRKRAIGEITRISMRYGWRSVVDQALHQAQAPTLRHMEACQLEALAAALLRLVDIAMTGCDLADDFPAR
ncbi:MAG: hypothetical protein ACREPD_15745 [Stenotrophomonas sp.]|uniref:hypothetical protein n=1 Tax=Stenotrophomonas sp. TaxID=69392 RepID=UPI003D6C9174